MNARGRFAPSKLPSIGFVLVVLVHLGFVGFLGWGFVQPPLDRVWELSHALRIGKVGTLAPRDQRLLQAALERHPGLTQSLLSQDVVGIVSAHDHGWLETSAATLLVSADAPAPCILRVARRPGARSQPLAVEVSGSGWRRQVALPEAGTEVVFPQNRHAPDIVEVRFSAKGARLDASAIGVHLGLGCATKGGHG